MTGPEHYKEAESLLVEMNAMIDDPASPMRDASLEAKASFMETAIAQAQVHATLAAAAATIDAAYGNLAENSRDAWTEARSDHG